MKIFLALVPLVLLGCSTPPPKGTEQTLPEAKWEWLMVTWNNRSIGLDTLRDSLSLFESENNATDPTQAKHQSVFVRQEVRDSIWMIAQRLIQTPTIREKEVTDYAGDYVRVKFYGGSLGTTQSLEYGSQNSWPSGGDLELLRRLTFDRFHQE